MERMIFYPFFIAIGPHSCNHSSRCLQFLPLCFSSVPWQISYRGAHGTKVWQASEGFLKARNRLSSPRRGTRLKFPNSFQFQSWVSQPGSVLRSWQDPRQRRAIQLSQHSFSMSKDLFNERCQVPKSGDYWL